MAQLRLKQLDSVLTGSLKVSGSLDVTGSLSASSLDVVENARFGEYIYHKGDADTFIQFTDDDDRINIKTGGVNMIYIVEGSGGAQADKVTINNDLADVDFQVKGDTVEDLIRTNAATDRVGIGTKNPDQILNIHGNLHVSGSTMGHITASGNISASFTSTGSAGRFDAPDGFYDSGTKLSDYVFEPEYVLRTLPEVEEHVTKHKHLPGIPSIDNIREWQGISIGDRQTLFLEKIEELTLYIIDLHKRIEKLEKK